MKYTLRPLSFRLPTQKAISIGFRIIDLLQIFITDVLGFLSLFLCIYDLHFSI